MSSLITFIDLFAGMGGFRIALENNGLKCVFSSEWDKYAQQTYALNFGELPYGDITNITNEQIPNQALWRTIKGSWNSQTLDQRGTILDSHS